MSTWFIKLRNRVGITFVCNSVLPLVYEVQQALHKAGENKLGKDFSTADVTEMQRLDAPYPTLPDAEETQYNCVFEKESMTLEYEYCPHCGKVKPNEQT